MAAGGEVVEKVGRAAPAPPQFIAVANEEALRALPVLELLGDGDAASVGSFVVVRNAYGIRQKLKNRGFRWNPATRDWRKPCSSRSDLEAVVRDAFSAGVRHVDRRSAPAVRQVVPDLFAK
jgi:hypothetical protein